MPWDQEAQLHGLDYGFYGNGLSQCRWIFSACFRHPLLGVLTAPIPLLGQRLLTLGLWPYWGFLLLVFSAVMAGCTVLVYAVLNAIEGAGRMCATAILAALLPTSFKGRWRHVMTAGLFVLALVLFAGGVSSFVTGNVR